MEPKEAWRIVKHKGCVHIPSVQRKVEVALRIVEPHLLGWEHMHLHHEMGVDGCHINRRGYDFVCKVIEDRLFRGIEFKGSI